MQWDKRSIHLNQYKYTSTNQHGDRFKRNGQKIVSVVTLQTPCDNIADLTTLILFSHHLNVPVHYDFNNNSDEPQFAYIEIVARESIKETING